MIGAFQFPKGIINHFNLATKMAFYARNIRGFQFPKVINLFNNVHSKSLRSSFLVSIPKGNYKSFQPVEDESR